MMNTHNTTAPRVSHWWSMLATLASAPLVLAACASTTPPPDAELAVSSAAVNSAISAGAAESAPEELRMAREKLDRARAEMAKEKYESAQALAREAAVDARLAESKALAVKSRKSASDLQEANRVLAEETSRKAPK
jgi:hypothetical protein